jgi:hypothetical protein
MRSLGWRPQFVWRSVNAGTPLLTCPHPPLSFKLCRCLWQGGAPPSICADGRRHQPFQLLSSCVTNRFNCFPHVSPTVSIAFLMCHQPFQLLSSCVTNRFNCFPHVSNASAWLPNGGGWGHVSVTAASYTRPPPAPCAIASVSQLSHLRCRPSVCHPNPPQPVVRAAAAIKQHSEERGGGGGLRVMA